MVAAVVGGGCSREASPEQKRADLVYQQAQQAVGRGRYHEARTLLFSVLPIDTRLGRLRRVAEEQRILGEIYASVADFDSSLLFYDRAREQLKSLADRRAVLGLTLEIASLHRRMGSERTALGIYDEALRLASVFDDHEGVREIQWAMLPACRALGETEEESHILSELLTSSASANDVGMQANVYYASGLSHERRSDRNGAMDNFLRALTLAEQAHDTVLAITVLDELGDLYDRRGKQQEAFQAFAEGLKRTDVTQGADYLRSQMLVRVGDIYLRDRQPGEARRFYRAALNAAINKGNRLAEGYLFIQLGHCDLPTSRDAAVKNYQAALDLFQGASYAPGSIYALYSLALSSQQRGRYVDAVTYLKSAVEQQDDCFWVRQENEFFRSTEEMFENAHQLSPYDAVIELLLQIGRNDEAFWYAERQRAREATLYLLSVGIRSKESGVDSLLRQFSHANALRVGAERQLAQMLSMGYSNREILKEIQNNLTRSSKLVEDLAPRIAAANGLLEPAVRLSSLGVVEVQRLLPTGTALLFPVPTRRSLYSFVLTNTSFTTAVGAVPRDRLHSTVGRFVAVMSSRRAFADSSANQVKAIDREVGDVLTSLYDVFVQPVERALAVAEKIIIVPQREFASVPIHALRRSTSLSSNSYVIERRGVSYLPSASTLRLCEVAEKRSRAQRGGSAEAVEIVGVGHPDGTTWDVEYELRDIRAFYRDARLYFGQQATLETLQKEHGSLLHLAAAFRFSDFAPGSASLLLSDAKGISSTRRVLLGELCTLPPYPTVMISDLSKDTPRMELVQPLVFLMNGTTSVIVNGYASTRKAKKFFGERYYTARLAGQSSQAALRQAQLDMIKNVEYSSPFLWGAFFLWGR
jgi:tetratricopeptide (TPR) repeat protein